MAHSIYCLKDGTVIPSVTTIIRRNLGWGQEGLLGFYRGTSMRGQDPEQIRDKAAAFGTYVHLCIELDLMWAPLDDEIRPHMSIQDIENGHTAFTLWKQWAERHNVKVLKREQALVSEKYRYGGTLDLLALVDKKLSLIDLKTTSQVRVTHFIQLSAYEKMHLENGGKNVDPFILHVSYDRRPTVHRRDRSLSKEWQAFKHLLALDKLRQEIDG